MFALPKGEHFEKQIFVQYGIDLTNHLKSNTTFCLLFRLILTFANLVNSAARGPVLWVFKSKNVKNLNSTDRGRSFSSLGDFHHRPSSGRNVIRTTTTQHFTKTSQELPIMSRSLSDCQEVTLMVTLLGDLCGMINLIRCLQKSIFHAFGLILIFINRPWKILHILGILCG